jgi:hypothetical protein
VELPSEVLIHNDVLGLKGTKARLLTIAREGYYEVNLSFGDRVHRVLLPVRGTVVISAEPEPDYASTEVER